VVPPDDQLRANSLLQTSTVIAELTGTALAGVLVATLHAYWIAFAVDAATFALPALLVRTVHHPTAAAPRQQSTRAAAVGGFRAVRSSPSSGALLLVFTALAFALSPMAVLLTPYVVDTPRISTGWIGLIQAGDTAGNVVGGILVAVAARLLATRVLVGLGMIALGTFIASPALASTLAGLLAAYLVFGLLTAMIQTGIGACPRPPSTTS
jgi:hypothetical protein